MNQPKHQLTKCSKWQREDGVAILIALGIISLVLVIGMGYAFSSYVGAKQSSLVTNVFTARLLADSAVEKAASFIELELAGVPAPHRYFKEGGAGTTWEDRYYVASYNTQASDSEVSQVEIVGYDYIPEGTTDDSVHWTYTTVDSNLSGNGTSMSTTVIGRQAYAIFDNTGMMDPSVFADPSDHYAGDSTFQSYAIDR